MNALNPMHRSSPKQILVIALRYLGDVLLTTTLPHALRSYYPGCQVDVLAFRGTEGMLENNPDVRRTYTIPERPTGREMLSMIRQLWRRYDIALVTQPGDKPHIFGLAASRRRLGMVPPETGHAWWKRLSLSHPLPIDEQAHRIYENERIAALLGIPAARELVPPTAHVALHDWPARLAGLSATESFDARRPFAVIHPSPRWQYKRWHTPGWRALLSSLHYAGLQVLLSGGPGESETRYLDEILDGLDAEVRTATLRIQGHLSLAELADLLHQARVYVGPDTATTHLAAACGTPTLALFGPTDPCQWGPSPARGLDQGWLKSAPRQVRGNVILLQDASKPCVPCRQEGCDRHRGSHSACLDELPTGTVVAEAIRMLAMPPDDEPAGAIP